MNLTRLKIELLCKGARTEQTVDKGRRGGAGPAGGRYFLLPNQTCTDIPLQGKFVEGSPFKLAQENGKWLLNKNAQVLFEVKPIPKPEFHDKATSDYTPMKKIAVLHGKDCLASTVYSKCVYFSRRKQCRFCGIELGSKDRLIQKQPQQLGEVAEEAFKEGVAKHVTLTTGTPPSPDRGALLLSDATMALKEHVSIPVHVQLEPLQDTSFLETLYHVGVDTVGLHVESFDPNVLNSVCPAKPSIKYFLKAWKNAVQIFGEGQVSTFVIAGLGETDESVVQGAEKVAQLGVIPYLLPLRPISGTFLEETTPPLPERMMKLYRKVAETLHSVGLDPRKNKAGCVRCGACSALQEAFILPP